MPKAKQPKKRAKENLKKAGLIKPILYHSFEEKEALERELFSKIPPEEVKRKWEALMNIFYEAGKKKREEQNEKQ